MERTYRTILMLGQDDANVVIEAKVRGEHYSIYVNDEFWGTCETRHEVDEEIRHIIDTLQLRSILG